VVLEIPGLPFHGSAKSQAVQYCRPGLKYSLLYPRLVAEKDNESTWSGGASNLRMKDGRSKNSGG
jgi:hypothetical protein